MTMFMKLVYTLEKEKLAGEGQEIKRRRLEEHHRRQLHGDVETEMYFSPVKYTTVPVSLSSGCLIALT